MDRGGGHFTPRGRFWRRGGGSRSSPSSSGSTDPRTPVGVEPSSLDRVSGDTCSTVGGSGERSWHSDERFSGGRQRSGKIQLVWKHVQPVAYKAGDTRLPGDDSRESSCHSDARSSGERKSLGQSQQVWKQVQPVAYKAGDTSSPVDGLGERSWHRDERSSGPQRSGQSQPAWKQVQTVAYKASAGLQVSPLSSSRDKTDFELSSKELNYQAEIVDESCPRNVRPSNDGHKSRQWYKDFKQAQPVANEASSAHNCPPSSDGTDWEISSLELNYRAEIVGMDSRLSDVSSDCTKKGSADGRLALGRNLRSLNAKSSILSERSSQRNERLKSQRHTSRQLDTDWIEVEPVPYLACRTEIIGSDATQSKKSNLSSDSAVGISKSSVPEEGSADGPLALDQSHVKNLESFLEKSSISTEYPARDRLSCCKDPESVGVSEKLNELDSSQHSECVKDAGPFDICPPKGGLPFVLQPTLLSVNKGKRNQMNRALVPKASVLRSGMVLLKNFISASEQGKVVKECRNLGLGTGGFYQPGYRDGAKLSLKMMCLGKNWDPDTGSYGNIRPIDGARPPPMPINFLELVKSCIKESHTLIAKECVSTERAEDILPWMSPDICIVNFYPMSGRLGLHQDRDESPRSLDKGLPVVSISIGDNAEFLYGDQRDVDKAEKVTLESGDVLIFGGESRHVFHGVSSIQPNTAPKSLLKETNLRAGRLNLTFREY